MIYMKKLTLGVPFFKLSYLYYYLHYKSIHIIKSKSSIHIRLPTANNLEK